MSELISNLNTIESYKLDIKSAIADKGVDMTNASLADYANCIASISGGTFVTQLLDVDTNGTYYPPEGVDGFSQVIVDVTQSVTGYTFAQCVSRVGYFSSEIYDTDVTGIHPWALAGAYTYTSGNTTKYGYYATKIQSINLPNVTNVFTYGCAFNSMLTYVSLPKCYRLETYAFYWDTALAIIDLPSVQFICGSAFAGCTALVSVFLSSCVSIYDSSVFTGCSNLSDVRLPVCQRVGIRAFNDCKALSSIHLPSCTYIGNYAFAGCTLLENITIGGSSVCSLNNANAFQNTKISIGVGSIYVPSSLVAAYKAATNWKTYSTKIFAIPT